LKKGGDESLVWRREINYIKFMDKLQLKLKSYNYAEMHLVYEADR